MALSSAGMSRRAFQIAAVVTALGLFGMVVRTAVVRAREADGLSALDASEPIPYFIADGRGNPGYQPSDRELALWALQAWQRISPNRIRFTAAASESTALVRVYWAEPSEGQFGETQPLAVGGRLGAATFIRPDVDSLGPELAERAHQDPLLRDSIVYLTCLHELGHAMGLAHTDDFRDIMYFFGYGGDIVAYFGRYRAELHSRSDIATVSGMSEADAGWIRTMYGK
jgi:hypothetical protein